MIAGPTASGKTALSLRLAREFGGEVINADSRQFYIGMDIGTAKIMSAEMAGVPHHLLSFLRPDEACTAAEYKRFAEAKIAEIYARNRIPFLVGGSGLFIDAVCKNLQIPRVPPQDQYRKALESKSNDELFDELALKDAQAAARIHRNNRVRLIRTLEIIAFGGSILHELENPGAPQWDIFKIALWNDPEALAERIAERTEAIWRSGFVTEVRTLLAEGYGKHTPALIAHGYREAIRFLSGDITESEAKEQMTLNTRRYAKRQRTWWRRDKAVKWVEGE